MADRPSRESVGQAAGKLLTHMVAYVSKTVRLEVTAATGMGKYEEGYHLTPGHKAWAVAAAGFARGAPTHVASVQELKSCSIL